jgi:ubiquinone/menaquinone biosynthesis C-methylase UbiE
MPIASFLQSYYENNFNKIYQQYDANKKITFYGEQRFAKHICRYFDVGWTKRQKSLRIIDFGGGDGSLAAAVARRLECKATVMVIDHGPEWIREGSICIERKQFVESIQQRCHIVIASASIEHVPHPHPTIEKLYSLLEPGGYFYARTPFVSPFMEILDIYDFGYPAHLHDLGPAFWNSFVQLFANDASCIVSQPSIVETCFRKNPIKTMIASALKLPAHLEIRIRPARRHPVWQFVGGWEVVFRKKSHQEQFYSMVG